MKLLFIRKLLPVIILAFFAFLTFRVSVNVYAQTVDCDAICTNWTNLVCGPVEYAPGFFCGEGERLQGRSCPQDALSCLKGRCVSDSSCSAPEPPPPPPPPPSGCQPVPLSLSGLLDYRVGYGRFATGGTCLFHVRNLAASGTGSLRDALSKPGRWIVFDVSGTIASGGVDVPANTTIDGRGANITIDGTLGVKSSNVIIENVTIDNVVGGELEDGIEINGIYPNPGPDQIWIDRVTFVRTPDELLAIWGHKTSTTAARNITVTRSYFMSVMSTSSTQGTPHAIIVGSVLPDGTHNGKSSEPTHLTIACNIFESSHRQPNLADGATAHLFNNLHARYIEGSTVKRGAKMLIENDIYDGSRTPDTHKQLAYDYTDLLGGEVLRQSGSLLLGGASGTEINPSQAFTPPYPYSLKPADSSLRPLIENDAGANATGGGCLTPGAAPVCTENVVKSLHPERGENLTDWNVGVQTSTNHSIVVADWGGNIGRALRYDLRAGDPTWSGGGFRAELNLLDNVSPGAKRLYTREIYIPESWNQGSNSGFNDRIIHQWHAAGGSSLPGWSPVWGLRQFNGSSGTVARKGTDEKWGPADGTLSIPRGQWVTEKVEVYWTSASDGYMKWTLGSQTVSYSGPTLLGDYQVYEKTGIYGQPTVYYERNHEIYDLTGDCNQPPPPPPEVAADFCSFENARDDAEYSNNLIAAEDGEALFTENLPEITRPEGETVPYSGPFNFTFSVDFAQLQSLFAPENSGYLAGDFQSQAKVQQNVAGLSSADLNEYYAPNNKLQPLAVSDKLKENYVNYIYDHGAHLPEYQNTYTDVDGNGPQLTITDLVDQYGRPQAPDSREFAATWNNTWGKYWPKIPTTYNEIFQGHIWFHYAAGDLAFNLIKKGDLCPIFDKDKTINFIMPEYFRAAQSSEQLSQILVPKAIQEDNSHKILGFNSVGGSASNPLSEFLTVCQQIVSGFTSKFQTDLVKTVKISLEHLNPVKDVFAQSDRPECIPLKQVVGDKVGSSYYCPLPQEEVDRIAGVNGLSILSCTGSVCTFSVTIDKQMNFLVSRDDPSCRPAGGGNYTCNPKLRIWPNFRIPWSGRLWGNTVLNTTENEGSSGVYGVFTPKSIEGLNILPRNDEAGKTAESVAPDDVKLDYVGAVDCNKKFARDFSLKPRFLQKLFGLNPSCE